MKQISTAFFYMVAIFDLSENRKYDITLSEQTNAVLSLNGPEAENRRLLFHNSTPESGE